MSEAKKYFPEGVAIGDAFINRQEEQKYLISRIKLNQHTVLMAPRRYGKTSLVIEVSNATKIPYCSIDLLAAYNAGYVRNQIVSKISHLVFELLPPLSKAKEKLLAIFQQMKPEISIGVFGQRLSLSLSNQPLQDITELLLKLDEVAKQFKKQAVVFLDEFQQISQLKNHHSIEASIRHAVERSENIAYVFSGSNRHLLKQMFGDNSRPLYRLCQTITIDRMENDVYRKNLQHLAKSRWNKTLLDNVIERIFKHTELHPYYMNVLCQIVWESEDLPSINIVDTIWHNYVKNQRYIISHDVSELSPNQRKILTALAKAGTKEIQSTEFTVPIKISPSSAYQAVEVLMRSDMVYKDNIGVFRVLDPAMRYYLDTILWEN